MNSATVLDFFTQNDAGTGVIADFSLLNLTNAQVESLAESFAFGYEVCTASDTTTENFLAIGTNNSRAAAQTTANGRVWGNVVNAIKTYVSSNDPQVVILGGSDLESWGYQSEPAAMNWIAGYDNTATQGYYDFGSADGCSQTSDANGTCSVPGSTDWNQFDYWYASWGAPLAFPVPEIPYVAEAEQWGEIDDYGTAHQSNTMTFIGPMSENARISGALTANQAWNDLQTYTGQNGFAFNIRLSSGGA